jgi:UDP-N-acetylmuramyl pentapeptide phosphotransferase/UDP-N-acetylglucosamine-1-phosphate transferase
MNYFLLLTLLILLSFLLSVILVKALIIIMPKFDIVDRPGNRRAHSKITPRAGGLAFVITFFLLLPIFEQYTFGTLYNSINILQIFAPIALVSFWDDVSDIPVVFRLFIHILCACLAIMWLIHPYKVLHSELPLMVDLVIGAFALLTFLNVYNFLDGIDGITVSQSIHLSLTILILCFIKSDIIPNIWAIMNISCIILGWSCGFILFNWQPAKIFPGDVGSISLGFLLGICLLTVASGSERLFASCVIASLYYIADGGMTLLIRLVNGEKIWQPHLQHFFQKAVKNGLSHKQVVTRIIECNFILMLLAIGALSYPVICVILGLFTVAVTLIRFVRYETDK